MAPSYTPHLSKALALSSLLCCAVHRTHGFAFSSSCASRPNNCRRGRHSAATAAAVDVGSRAAAAAPQWATGWRADESSARRIGRGREAWRSPTSRRCASETAAAVEGDTDEQEEEEEDDGSEELFEELPEEIEEVRGAFLDRPGQMLDVDKILRETEHIEHDGIPDGFRTGYVTIVGSPNVGKSTLMNNMIGDRLSIVTPKAGTTRHRITGIMTGDDFQMIYQDTPGVLTPAYMLHEGMMNFVQEAMGDADAILFVTDLFETEFANTQIFERMLAAGKPIVVAVNKVDLLPSDGKSGDGPERPGLLAAGTQKEVGSLKDVLDKWEERLPGATVLPISALEGINTVDLAGELKKHIPEGPPLFGTDVMSDKPQRFFAAEIIREQIFGSFSQEIPYSCEVLLGKFKERMVETVIDATIVVSQESQKGMVIGKKGAKIKEVGIKARVALEEHLGTRVNLRLNVKVDKNWRRKKTSLKEYGYMS
ncbi:unnamed protein product [Ectocarpus fasciculatus]